MYKSLKLSQIDQTLLYLLNKKKEYNKISIYILTIYWHIEVKLLIVLYSWSLKNQWKSNKVFQKHGKLVVIK